MSQVSPAEKLRVLRARAGLTLTEVAEKSGIGRDTLGYIERGVRHPSVPTLSKLAKAYEIPVENLLEDPVLEQRSSPGTAEPAVPLAQAPPEPSDEERRLTVSAEIVEEHRALFGICAVILDEINGTFGPYLEGLSPNPVPEQWEAESQRIKEGLSGIEAVINTMSKYGVPQKLEPYVAAIAEEEPVPPQLRQEAIDLFNTQRSLYGRVIPLAKEKRLTRLTGAELEKLATIDAHADKWRAELEKLDTLEALVPQWRSSLPAEVEIPQGAPVESISILTERPNEAQARELSPLAKERPEE